MGQIFLLAIVKDIEVRQILTSDSLESFSRCSSACWILLLSSFWMTSFRELARSIITSAARKSELIKDSLELVELSRFLYYTTFLSFAPADLCQGLCSRSRTLRR
jgi:hypothetical protein